MVRRSVVQMMECCIYMKINFENGVFFKITYIILLAYALGKEALLGFGV